MVSPNLNEEPKGRQFKEVGGQDREITPKGQNRQRSGTLVTTNACNECRKKRSKCDGQQPCKRCDQRVIDCRYEAPNRQRKRDMRLEIDELRRSLTDRDAIISALCHPDLGGETTRRLQRGGSMSNVLEWLDTITNTGPKSYHKFALEPDPRAGSIPKDPANDSCPSINNPMVIMPTTSSDRQSGQQLMSLESQQDTKMTPAPNTSPGPRVFWDDMPKTESTLGNDSHEVDDSAHAIASFSLEWEDSSGPGAEKVAAGKGEDGKRDQIRLDDSTIERDRIEDMERGDNVPFGGAVYTLGPEDAIRILRSGHGEIRLTIPGHLSVKPFVTFHCDTSVAAQYVARRRRL